MIFWAGAGRLLIICFVLVILLRAEMQLLVYFYRLKKITVMISHIKQTHLILYVSSQPYVGPLPEKEITPNLKDCLKGYLS